MSEENNLEAMRLLATRHRLTKELVGDIGEVCRKFANRKDVEELTPIDQVSCLYSAFLTLWVHFKLHEIGGEFMDPADVQQAL